MVRFILLLALAVVIARTFWRFFDAIVRAAGGTSARGTQGGKPVSVKMQQCPVCGTYVVPGKAITVVSGGNSIYFDSEKCRAEHQSR